MFKRIAGKVKRHLSDRLNSSYRLPGECVVCGERTHFFIENIDTLEHARETLSCIRCYSSSRKRHVARVLLGSFSSGAKSVAAAREDLFALSIYSTVSNDCFQRILGQDNPGFVCSELFPDRPEGDITNGVYCQNLERLTFGSEQFDVLLTEDVLEHVRKPEAAFREIYRVLKPGGVHIFTIPFHFDKKTVSRIDSGSEIDVDLLPREYHADATGNKVLVYTDWGYDLFTKLDEFGFQTQMVRSTYRDLLLYRIADSIVFISRKV